MVKQLSKLLLLSSALLCGTTAMADPFLSVNLGVSNIAASETNPNSSASYRIALGYDWQIMEDVPLALNVQAGLMNWGRADIKNPFEGDNTVASYHVEPTLDLMVGVKYTFDETYDIFFNNGLIRGQLEAIDNNTINYVFQLGAGYHLNEDVTINVFYLRSLGKNTNLRLNDENKPIADGIPPLQMFGAGFNLKFQ